MIAQGAFVTLSRLRMVQLSTQSVDKQRDKQG